MYFGDSGDEVAPTSPNFTIYKEGGVGYTKYTVYTKDREDMGDTSRVERSK